MFWFLFLIVLAVSAIAAVAFDLRASAKLRARIADGEPYQPAPDPARLPVDIRAANGALVANQSARVAAVGSFGFGGTV